MWLGGITINKAKNNRKNIRENESK